MSSQPEAKRLPVRCFTARLSWLTEPSSMAEMTVEGSFGLLLADGADEVCKVSRMAMERGFPCRVAISPPSVRTISSHPGESTVSWCTT